MTCKEQISTIINNSDIFFERLPEILDLCMAKAPNIEEIASILIKLHLDQNLDNLIKIVEFNVFRQDQELKELIRLYCGENNPGLIDHIYQILRPWIYMDDMDEIDIFDELRRYPDPDILRWLRIEPGDNNSVAEFAKQVAYINEYDFEDLYEYLDQHEFDYPNILGSLLNLENPDHEVLYEKIQDIFVMDFYSIVMDDAFNSIKMEIKYIPDEDPDVQENIEYMKTSIVRTLNKILLEDSGFNKIKDLLRSNYFKWATPLTVLGIFEFFLSRLEKLQSSQEDLFRKDLEVLIRDIDRTVCEALEPFGSRIVEIDEFKLESQQVLESEETLDESEMKRIVQLIKEIIESIKTKIQTGQISKSYNFYNSYKLKQMTAQMQEIRQHNEDLYSYIKEYVTSFRN